MRFFRQEPLSGAPKLRACEIIDELEDNKRGIYGGAIGYLDFTGNLDTCIAIRLAFQKTAKYLSDPGPVLWLILYRKMNFRSVSIKLLQ